MDTGEFIRPNLQDVSESSESMTPAFCPSCGMQTIEGHHFCGICGYRLSHKAPVHLRDPLVGSVVAGRYRLLAKIGAGGMGSVYKVEHVRMGKLMAMKILHGDLSRDPSMVQRFNREARAVSRLTSVHSVQVFDYGNADGLIFLAMEYLRGRDFGALLRELGPLSLERCASVVDQIATALGEAHEQGVIHRDIKPENLFLCAPSRGKEVVKVLDFGLAKLISQQELNAQTLQDVLIGTPYYMSPEHISGKSVGPKSDIYSLGAVLFHLLTGEPPYGGTAPLSVLMRHLNEPVPDVCARIPNRPELGRIESVLKRAMAKDPNDRYDSVRDMANAFRRCAEQNADEDVAYSKTEAHLEALPSPEDVDPPENISRPETAFETQKSSATDWFRKIDNMGTVSEDFEEVSTREDWERYEFGLRAKRIAWWVVTIVVCVAGGAGAWWWWGEGNAYRNAKEVEPNNATLQATRVFLDEPIQGTIGLPPEGERADVDFFVLTPPPEATYYDLSVSGIDGIDLILEVFDASGTLIARSNTRKIAQPESLTALLARGQPIYVSVREVWAQGVSARSNLAASYTLIAKTRNATLALSRETEPNDLHTTAQALDPNTSRLGLLSHLKDLDLFALPPLDLEGSLLTLTLENPCKEGPPIRVFLRDASGAVWTTFSEGLDEGNHSIRVFLAPTGVQPFHLALSPAPSKSTHHACPEPYTLRYTLSPPSLETLTTLPIPYPKK